MWPNHRSNGIVFECRSFICSHSKVNLCTYILFDDLRFVQIQHEHAQHSKYTHRERESERHSYMLTKWAWEENTLNKTMSICEATACQIQLYTYWSLYERTNEWSAEPVAWVWVREMWMSLRRCDTDLCYCNCVWIMFVDIVYHKRKHNQPVNIYTWIVKKWQRLTIVLLHFWLTFW